MQVKCSEPSERTQACEPSLHELKTELDQAIKDLMELRWSGAKPAMRAAQLAIVEKAQARYQRAVEATNG